MDIHPNQGICKQAFVVIQDRLAGGMQKAVGDLPVTAVNNQPDTPI